MALRIRIDRERCVGSTMCLSIAPAVFDLDDEGKSTVKDPQGASEEELREAAESCPSQAIVLEDEESGQQVYP